MKKLFVSIVVCVCFLFLNFCSKLNRIGLDGIKEKMICACEVINPAKSLPWLAELIANAEEDTVNHYGILSIWLEEYNGQDVFVVNTMLGNVGSAISGHSAYYVFDCQGHGVLIGFDEDVGIDVAEQDIFFNNLKKDILVYASPKYPNKEMYACGVVNPEINNTWLADLIAKAEEDTIAPKYYGAIWFKQYNGQDVFVSDIPWFVGGAMGCALLDCQGNGLIAGPMQGMCDFRSILLYVHPKYVNVMFYPDYTYMPYIY